MKHVLRHSLYTNLVWGGDYISRFAGMKFQPVQPGYFTLRLHVEIKFHQGKAGQFSTCYLFRFASTFFEFFFEACQFTKLKTHRFPLI